MLKLRTFGGLWIEQDDRRAGTGAMRRRALALLALLAAAPDSGLTRDKVLPYLWPESDEGKAKHVLAQLLYVLRRRLGSDEMILDTGALRLNPHAMQTDVAEFRGALARGDAQHVAAIHEAPFLDGFFLNDAPQFERWVEGERARFAAQARTAIESLAGAATSGGDHAQAVKWWRRVTAMDPLSSRATASLMRALVACGDRVSALQEARVHEALVREELGDMVDPEIPALALRIRDATLEPDATPAAPELPPTIVAARQRYEEYVRRVLAPRYRIERTLGRRSLGTTFLATDARSGQPVQVRALLPSLAAIIDAPRLLDALRASARIRHGVIFPIIDLGQVEDVIYIATPPQTGDTLAAWLVRERQLSVHEVLRVGTQVADALAHAHQAGILHLDLTPRRILLDGDRVFVLELGVVAAVLGAMSGSDSQTGVAVGTPAYMSPEQLDGSTADGRADIYSLGCILYQALAGEAPHAGINAQSILSRRLTESPRPLRALRETIPADVERAVMTALARVPADRYRSMAEMRDALRASTAR